MKAQKRVEADAVAEALDEVARIEASIAGNSLGFANPDEDRQAVKDYRRHAELLRALANREVALRDVAKRGMEATIKSGLHPDVTRSDLLLWMAQRLELDGYKAFSCTTCDREGLIPIDTLWQELRTAAADLRTLREWIDAVIAKLESTAGRQVWDAQMLRDVAERIRLRCDDKFCTECEDDAAMLEQIAAESHRQEPPQEGESRQRGSIREVWCADCQQWEFAGHIPGADARQQDQEKGSPRDGGAAPSKES